MILGRFCLFLFLCCTIVSGCQNSDDPTNVLQSDQVSQIKSFGDGGFTVGLILPFEQNNLNPKQVRDYQSGAQFAVEKLGKSRIKLVQHTVNGSDSSIIAAAQQLLNSDAKFLIGPANSRQAELIGELTSVPVLALSGNSGKTTGQTFTFRGDSVSGVLEATKSIYANGPKKTFVLYTKSTTASDLKRIEVGVQRLGGVLTGSATFLPVNSQIATSIKPNVGKIENAEILIALGSVQEVETLLASNLLPLSQIKIVSEQGSKSFVKIPVYRGVVFARMPAVKVRVFGEKYATKYNSQPSLETAYGFDAVALAVGLQRSGADQSKFIDILKRPEGYNGTTGLFRFMENGEVERRHEIYQVRNESAELVQERGTGF